MTPWIPTPRERLAYRAAVVAVILSAFFLGIAWAAIFVPQIGAAR